MLITLDDISEKCPLYNWVYKVKHSIPVQLVTGETLMFRGTITEISEFKCSVDMLRKATPSLADRSDDTLVALQSLIKERFVTFVKDQLDVGIISNRIINSLKAGNFFLVRVDLEELLLILAEYGVAAILAGWASWIELCRGFILLNEKKGKKA